MNDKLKKFVTEHRQEFDTREPGKDLWKKIDAQIEIKNPSKISSKWLSRFTYLGFGASILIVAGYFITKSLNAPSVNVQALYNKGSEINNLKQSINIEQKNKYIAQHVNEPDSNRNETQSPIHVSSDNNEVHLQGKNGSPKIKKDSTLDITSFEVAVFEQKKNPANEKKESELAISRKKTGIYIPAESEKINSYSGTLYDGASLCELLRVYKFTGKACLDKFTGTPGGKRAYRRTTVRTMSCSQFEKMQNVKAVWIKGRTDKELRLSIGKNFKNILLVKNDGRKLTPEAISHYYPGRGAISEYTGKSFELIFKDKVELILFFKEIEDGDKVIIDETIETVVKNKP